MFVKIFFGHRALIPTSARKTSLSPNFCCSGGIEAVTNTPLDLPVPLSATSKLHFECTCHARRLCFDFFNISLCLQIFVLYLAVVCLSLCFVKMSVLALRNIQILIINLNLWNMLSLFFTLNS